MAHQKDKVTVVQGEKKNQPNPKVPVETNAVKVPPKRIAQQTLQYKLFIKRTISEALENAFDLYEDPTLAKTKIGPNYAEDRADFPNIVVKFYEQQIKNIGVGHSEWGPQLEVLTGHGKTVKGSKEVELPEGESTADFFPGVTVVKAPAGGIVPEETIIVEVVDQRHFIMNHAAMEDEENTELRFTGTLHEKFIEYHHSLYSGDISLEVYALSSPDRDKVSDAIIEIVQMGIVGPEGSSFQDRIYHAIGKRKENGELENPYSLWHTITINTDTIQGYGETQTQPLWYPEDNLIYQVEYRFPILGEFYSITPKAEPGSIGLVKEVDFYPWATTDPEDIPPEDFPEEEIPDEDFIKVTSKPAHRRL